jgi:hypothetical protein
MQRMVAAHADMGAVEQPNIRILKRHYFPAAGTGGGSLYMVDHLRCVLRVKA